MAKKSYIESIGVYLPSNHLSTKEVMEGCRNKLKIDLEEVTGIKKRPVVGKDEYAIDLAIKAIAKCFETSRHSSEDIEMIISTNICRLNGPNYEFSYEPSTAARLAAHFDMRKAITFDISSACAGMFTGIQIVDSFIKAGLIRKGLVVSGEYISHIAVNAQKEISQPIDPQMASLTVGDSGAALLLEETDKHDLGFHRIELFTIGRHCKLCIGTNTKESHGGYVMYTDSIEAHRVAIKYSSELTAAMIKDTKWEDGNNFYTIPHQTSTKAISVIPRVFNKVLGKHVLSGDRLIMNLENRGNTSSTSHFVALWDYMKNGTLESGKDILFIILASGITVGAAVYTLDDLPRKISQKNHN